MDVKPADRTARMTLALAGDTMLGRGVAELLASSPSEAVFAPAVVEAVQEANLFVLNLECCISTRGAPWPDPRKPFFFRAPPAAVEALSQLGVDCVTLANNHALDFGSEALLDTLEHLRAAGIAPVGAGADVEAARSPGVLEANGFRLAVIGVTDHPADFAAGPDTPGVAFAPLGEELPTWLVHAVRSAEADAVLVAPHWGPQHGHATAQRDRERCRRPPRRRGDRDRRALGARLPRVAGRVLYDLGDFVDDYASDPVRRNDLGLLFLLTLDASGPIRLEALPLKLEYCHTRLAGGDDAAWIQRRFRHACAAFGTRVTVENDRLVVDWPAAERRTE